MSGWIYREGEREKKKTKKERKINLSLGGKRNAATGPQKLNRSSNRKEYQKLILMRNTDVRTGAICSSRKEKKKKKKSLSKKSLD